VIGLAATTAAAVAMNIARPLSDRVWAGLGLLALAGAAFPWTRRIPVLPMVVTLPGAWLISQSGLPGGPWVVYLVIVVAALSGPLISWFDEEADLSPIPAWLFAISVAGVWVTVPDTEEALVLLGAMAIPTLLAWPLGVARLGAIGGHSLVGLYMWVVVWGGRGREGSIVGAAAALGMLVAAPLGAWVARKQKVTTTGWSWICLIVIQLLLVAITARVAGFRVDPTAAVAIALPSLVVAVFGWVALDRALGHAPWSRATR
jgi:hypothetical protein